MRKLTEAELRDPDYIQDAERGVMNLLTVVRFVIWCHKNKLKINELSASKFNGMVWKEKHLCDKETT